VLPLREFGLEYQRMLPCLPQEPAVQSAPKKRLLMSWWDREIYIWRINKTSKSRREASDSDSEAEQHRQHRKLVAKVVVKGEANISSASITSEGSLLAVSTSAEIKIFRLSLQRSINSDTLRVKKLEFDARLSAKGAKLLQFSPDGHWLGIVRRDNRVITARVVDDGTSSFKIHSTLSELARLGREMEKRVLHGGLGAYDRTVTRIAFSSDSRILAVSDLAGFIDTWVLEGHENLAPTTNNDNVAHDTSLPPSSDRSDSEDEEEKQPINVLGQHWIRNPSASLLPRLPSAAVVLCFRPSVTAASEALSGALAILHPTRKNPYLHSNNLPQGDDRLMVVTASRGVMEFKVMQGALSAWSRRNPTSSFPEEFNRLRDQAMGCMWDIGKSKERLWLYGSSWMWMFDLSRDLHVNAPVQNVLTNGHVNGNISNIIQPRPNKRQKMNNGSKVGAEDLKKATSGAGGRVPDYELGTGISRRHQNIFHEGGKVRDTITDHRRRPFDMDLGDSDEQVGRDGIDSALKRLRRGEDATLTNGDEQLAKRGDVENETSPRCWHTYKYRPILGVVPIGNGEAGLEIALVERPTWEMDLPPRYYGDQDWEKPGL
jgi:U3 small nucleolar RNA-associated protein 4